ncbi:hypothetical protein, partial [uncultured Faecalibaculum sp.]
SVQDVRVGTSPKFRAPFFLTLDATAGALLSFSAICANSAGIKYNSFSNAQEKPYSEGASFGMPGFMPCPRRQPHRQKKSG